jgi:hypothetical protein
MDRWAIGQELEFRKTKSRAGRSMTMSTRCSSRRSDKNNRAGALGKWGEREKAAVISRDAT